jgi:hypothetical protein
MEKLAITDFQPDMEAFVNIRIYDGNSSSWFDNLGLPDKVYPYITPIRFTRWYSTNHRVIEAVVPIFGSTHSKYTLYLSAYDFMAYILPDRPYWESNLLEPEDLIRYPQILRS